MSAERTLEHAMDPSSDDPIPPSRSTHTCPWWVQYMLVNPVRRWMEKPVKLLAPLVEPGMVVVEPGCGMGAFSLDLARMVGPTGKVVCVDIEPRAVEKLKKRACRRGLADRIEASPCTSDSLGLDRWKQKVDLLLLAHVLHEVDDQMALLAQLHELLVPGGRLLLTEPPGHLTSDEYEQELARCRASGFIHTELPGGPQKRRDLFIKK